MSSLGIPGRRVDPQIGPGPRTNGVEVERAVKVQITGVREAAGLVTEQVRDDSVLVMHLEGGFKIFSRYSDFRDDFPPAQARGLEPGVHIVDPNLGIEGADRTIGTVVLQALEIFDIKPVEQTVLALAAQLENTLERLPGLYRLTLSPDFSLSEQPAAPEPGKAALIFVHGTASSSRGSYKALVGILPGSKLDFAGQIHSTYGDNVFAYEHRSLTESPVTNALQIANKLPDGAKLHVVSHSRGGLIGDLLCVGQPADGGSALDVRALNQLLACRPEVLSEIEELQRVLRAKRVQVERFVRVACPARGTTLASHRADRWFSILLSLIGQLPILHDPALSALYDALQDFLLAVLATKQDPATLPGIEAMMPGSPLIRMLNTPGTKSAADLSVIAGDTEGRGILGKLKMFLPDRFYGGQHDLVVNTASMDGGLPRVKARRFFDQGTEVNHFHYFSNPRTKERILAGLLRPDADDAGYLPLERKEVTIPERSVRGPAGPRPTVFLLPGIMGSHLSVDGDRVWLDYFDLFFGGMGRLKIGAEGVQAESVMADFYGRLVDYLSASHEVIAFPYDWRLSLRSEAKRLAQSLSEKMDSAERVRQPVRILAHSMGGLLAQTMIAEHADVWRRLIRQAGGRLVMLGTPCGGSHEILRVLTWQSRTFRQLELLDCQHNQAEMLDIVGRYPGLLEMLPRQPGLDFFDPAAWTDLRNTDKMLVVPLKKDLLEAAETRTLLDSFVYDPGHMVYVAGQSPQTPCELFISDGRIRFRATSEGDGRVPWKTGIPGGTAYYATAEHGDLANQPADFPAILDLLQAGATTRLPKGVPATVRDAARVFEIPADPVEVLPEQRAVAASALGATLAPKREHRAPRIQVSVTHGDLAFARYAVAVGHYQGDSIVEAEAHLDRHLGGRLKQWNDREVYPGGIGTAEVFFASASNSRPPGAIVIGLGRVGELTPKDLQRTYYNAALKFALSVAACPDDRFRDKDGLTRATISSLLIGTEAGGVTVEECMLAALRALKAANAALDRGATATVLISKVEFIELWEDRAIEAAAALDRAATDPELKDVIEIEPRIAQREGALRRLAAAGSSDWWSRVRVTKDERTNALRFAVISQRARSEVELVPQERAIVDQFIERAITSSASDDRLASTLFEMLVPNRLKEYAPELRRTVVVVDEESARYPWELLEDRLGRAERPISVESGFIRQLETKDFRETVVHGDERTALVVGNPATTMFINLPAAEREAQEVARVLTGRGVAVTAEIGSDAVSIVTDLHAAPYRILHFAGHGVHEFTPAASGENSTGKPADVKNVEVPARPVSGMVIGDNVFLTPAVVSQMRRVPELVFINCCHLGRTDEKDRRDTRRTDRNRLAANLAVEFINMGAKAVIAAGWAVNDRAASTFATRFYQYFLDGDTFGSAVQKARRDTYDSYPGVNTWGAYQCYGDPDFSFAAGATAQAAASRSQRFRLPAQLLIELENLACKAEVASGDEIEKIREETERVLNVPAEQRAWTKRADIQCMLGRLYGELGDYHKSAASYRESLAQEKATGPVRALEQGANMLVRAAVRDWTEKQIGSAEACELINEAIGQIDSVLKLGQTKERLSLKASAYKRRAMVAADGQTRLDSLREMVKAYQSAYELAGTESLYSEPLLNWLISAAILRWSDPAAEDVVRLHATDLDACLAAGIEKAKAEPDFWNSVIEPDCLMVRYVAASDRTDDTPIRVIAEAYRKAKEECGNERKVRTVLEHLEFLSAMARAYKPNDPAATALDRCREYLLSDNPVWVAAVPASVGTSGGV